jgi:branched-chain amino acid transport system substrate-binding protein
MNFSKTSFAAAIALLVTGAQADIQIGVILPLTGPASGLGIPFANQLKLFPSSIGGEKLTLIVLDDATDPAKGAVNARRLVTESKVDLIIGSCATPVAAVAVDIAAEAGTVQLACAPVTVAPGKEKWLYRLAQSNTVMGHALVEHMKKQGVKTLGFLGYSDVYGEQWLKEIGP